MVRARKRNSWEQLQLERIASRVNIKTMPNIEKFDITDVKVGVAALVKPEKTSRVNTINKYCKKLEHRREERWSLN